MGCFSGRLMSAASDQKLFCKLCSPFCCSFRWICRRESDLPVLFLRHLDSSPLMHSFLWLIFHYISVYHSFFIHSSVSGHLGCFHVLAIVNSTAVNIRVNVSFRIMVFWGYMPSSGIAGSYGSFIPSFLRNLHAVLHSGCISLYSHHCSRGFPVLHILYSIYFLQIFWWWQFWPVWRDTSV